MEKRKEKICFTGGGTMGPVTPLLAIWEQFEKDDFDCFWIGTKNGPEKDVIKNHDIRFFDIPVARLPRYFSGELILLPFRFKLACIRAFFLLLKEKPSVIVTAGGFSGVPVIFMGWLLRIPALAHQPDVKVLLSTKLTLPFTKRITAAWKKTVKKLPSKKTKWLGNPIRSIITEGKKDRVYDTFKVNYKLPTIVFIGGGTGSTFINELAKKAVKEFADAMNIIHVTGKGKRVHIQHKNYHTAPFLEEELADVLALADIVISRAGMGAISELSALSKASIFIPLPHSAQEENTAIIEEKKAGIIYHQEGFSFVRWAADIQLLFDQKTKRKQYGERLHGLLPQKASEKIAKEIKMLRKKNRR